METYKIGKQKVTFYGKKKGANTNKFNRVAKLASNFNSLDKKLRGLVERGNCETETARCAIATLLLLHTGIRVGNETSAEGYYTQPHPHAKNQESKFVKTYGLTTLLREHVVPTRKGITFLFVGKKQVENTFTVTDSTLVSYIKSLINCGKNPVFGITDYQLTKFIKRYVGKCFSPKDFRTLRANISAYHCLQSYMISNNPQTKSEKKLAIKAVCEYVASNLNNTPGVCKKSYIDDMLWTELD